MGDWLHMTDSGNSKTLAEACRMSLNQALSHPERERYLTFVLIPCFVSVTVWHAESSEASVGLG